jgi:hypothetical protein
VPGGQPLPRLAIVLHESAVQRHRKVHLLHKPLQTG